jgi:hypothetical protein
MNIFLVSNVNFLLSSISDVILLNPPLGNMEIVEFTNEIYSQKFDTAGLILLAYYPYTIYFKSDDSNIFLSLLVK